MAQLHLLVSLSQILVQINVSLHQKLVQINVISINSSAKNITKKTRLPLIYNKTEAMLPMICNKNL